MQRKVDVAIVGAGSAGLVALAQVRRAGKSFLLIDGGELGTTCARVGCMPSKAAIQVAEDFHRRHRMDRIGVSGLESLRIDTSEAMEHVRDLRDIFVDRVLSGTTDEMGDEFIEGRAEFLEPDVLEVKGQIVRAGKVIVATGSRPFVPPQWEAFADRVLTTDDLFEQTQLPESVAVIGLGVIGLEMGQMLHRLGVRVTGVDQMETIAGLKDPVVSQVAAEIIGKEFELCLGRPAEVKETDGKLEVRAGQKRVLVDKLLASLGRIPNVRGIGFEKLGVALDVNGVPVIDPNTMQVADLPVFIAGDATGSGAILHEAVHEGRIAGYNAVRDEPTAFRRFTPLAITFCDPNIVTVGRTWPDLDQESVVAGELRFGPVGRALILGKNRGVLRVYADRGSARILGAAMVAPHGEHLGHLLAWSIQQGLTVFDVLKLPFYHPVMEEAFQAVLRSIAERLGSESADAAELDPLGG
jgi:dihydrolipoamide dehydrogenase